MSVPFNIETSFAGAEISDGPHKGALEGLDRMILCLCIIYDKRSIYVNTFSFFFVCPVFFFFCPAQLKLILGLSLAIKVSTPGVDSGIFFFWGGAHLKELEKMMDAVIGRAKN